MNDDVSDIQQIYDEDPETEDDRLIQHQLEWDLTWRYLDRYLPRNGPILEVGAGPGRYTAELANRGYRVTAVDFSQSLIAMGQRHIVQQGLEAQVEFVLADVRDLSGLHRTDYAAALVMGPLYHLVVEEDRRLALAQVRERLRPEGWPKGGFRGYFAIVEEIAPLHEDLGFETAVFAAVEPAISADDESYNRLQGEERRAWLDLLYAISAEPSIVGASRHLLYIGKKR